ncbi:M15 family metallopeptidase [Paraflavitalea sp. CAU 1676]|uniref:M15 family metallopeptidase n=1 Tax=Paraflavitalea sp. CAU 1676 TaxID=3032598 RepID=UPI0023DBA63E|nr:M15 family metallopeptidase [Paraflavitalea sp. CAU 1676]MDF2190052.1 M15 family metallopeptidase [Paraflavitalea sp. CAU 1676]
MLFFFHQHGVQAQDIDIKRYGVPVIGDLDTYQAQVQGDSSKKMVELKSLMPDLVYDLRYATTNNFMHRRMYNPPPRVTFLRAPAARALARVQAELGPQGYGLKIFDAYRPYSVTVAFWELVKDERYVANPAKGSGHNRGLAVDLTIVDLSTGKELDMGTGFDNFTDTAHQDFKALPAQVLQHRETLTNVMRKHGFTAIETEWWHFYWPNDRQYEVLNIPFSVLSAGKR